MKKYWFLVPLALSLAAAHPAAAVSCDSQCLKRIVQQYLAQLPLHTVGSLPVAKDAILVENAKPTDFSQGSWALVTKVRSGQTFVDPITGQAVFYGAVDTPNGLRSFFVRLKIVDRAIAEEEIFSRGGEPRPQDIPGAAALPPGMPAMPPPDFSGLLEPDVLYTAEVPVERRLPRAGLIGVIRGYLKGIGEHNGKIPAFSYRCDRYSAGTKFTNNPDNPVSRGGGSCAGSLMNLKGQTPANVRFAVVDEKLGVVVAMFIIPHAERHPQGATNVGELFKIVDGKIRSIEEFSFVAGYPPESGFKDESWTAGPASSAAASRS